PRVASQAPQQDQRHQHQQDGGGVVTISMDAAVSLAKRKAVNDMHIRVAMERIKLCVMTKDFSSASSEVDDLKMLLEEGKDLQRRIYAADISEDMLEE